MPESKDRLSIVDVFERLWGQALVAVSHAEDEALRATNRLSELTGWGQDEGRRYAREFAERLIRQRRELEHFLDEGVRHSLSRLRVPRREEVQDLQARLDRVSARLDAIARR